MKTTNTQSHIIKAKTYTVYLAGGLTFTLEVRENGITDMTANWANGEDMELNELSLHPSDITRLAELFALAGFEVNA